MTAARHDLTIEQGASFRRSLIWKDPKGRPIDLGVYTGARMQIREKVGGKTYATLELGAGITLVPAEGRIDLYLSRLITAGMDFERAEYDLFLDQGTMDSDRVLWGEVELQRAITR